MWNKFKSFALTQTIIRVCYVLLAVVSIAMPFVLSKNILDFDILADIKEYIMIPFYLVVPAGYVALVCLDKLLMNMKREIVFDKANVRLLGLVSWACFCAGCVGLGTFLFLIIFRSFTFETMLVLACGEYFMWLVVRVVKHIFEAAIDIKEENDLTI